MKDIGRTGYELGSWPHPRPTGLDCYLAREHCGLTQAQMARELGVARRTIIYWERQGATMLVPGRLHAQWIAHMLTWATATPRKVYANRAALVRVDANGLARPA